jgi:hypothetical protein
MTKFTKADADRAHDEWGANCGPGALAAILDMTLDDVRPHMGDFERKRYTNPSLMFAALKSIGTNWSALALDGKVIKLGWPIYGLARIQWEGPWTEPSVPVRARYRYTHWVGSARGANNPGIFDINCMNNGTGWCSLDDWKSTMAPYLIAQYPRANGKWHITHAIEIFRSESPSPKAVHK